MFLGGLNLLVPNKRKRKTKTKPFELSNYLYTLCVYRQLTVWMVFCVLGESVL